MAVTARALGGGPVPGRLAAAAARAAAARCACCRRFECAACPAGVKLPGTLHLRVQLSASITDMTGTYSCSSDVTYALRRGSLTCPGSPVVDGRLWYSPPIASPFEAGAGAYSIFAECEAQGLFVELACVDVTICDFDANCAPGGLRDYARDACRAAAFDASNANVPTLQLVSCEPLYATRTVDLSAFGWNAGSTATLTLTE